MSDDVDGVMDDMVDDSMDDSGLDTVDESVDDVSIDDGGQVDDLESSVSLSEGMLSRAEQYGLSKDLLDGMDDKRAEALFAAIDQRLMAPPSNDGGDGDKLPAQSAPPQTIFGEFQEPFKVEFGEDIDESVSSPVSGLVESLNKEFRQLHEFKESLGRTIGELNLRRELADFDSHIASMGDEWSDVYGSGPTVDMDQKSEAFKNRMEVFWGSQSLINDSQRRGNQLGRRDAWTRSHAAKNYTKLEERARKKVVDNRQKRESMVSERPSGGKTPKMTPREAAIAALKG